MLPYEETAQVNPRWAAAIIQACINNGVDHFFVAPGSRCTPLTLAIAHHPHAKAIRHFDERGLAFACMGFGRSQQMLADRFTSARPAAFVCTSGTAVVNAFPAVIESAMDHVPMLLLTSDRPPELIDIGANQAINQKEIFGTYPAFYANVDCPTSRSDFTEVEGLVREACAASANGPSHLNFQIREPFGTAITIKSGQPVGDRLSHPPETLFANSFEPPTFPDGDVLIMLGGCSTAERMAVIDFAERTSAVLLGDVTSGWRQCAFDLALIRDDLPLPNLVLHIGGRIVSKRWLQFLERHRESIENIWHVWPHHDILDPARCVTNTVCCDIAQFCDAASVSDTTSGDFKKAWETACEDSLQLAVDRITRDDNRLTEPAVAHTISQLTPESSVLFLGNSMPIRDMNMFGTWPAQREKSTYANRGASGIDGLIATASGVAQGHGVALTLVMGDLSALHDLNSLALLAAPDHPPITLVIINNDGGGIFHFLPIAEQTSHFEEFFGTPHGIAFREAAGLFGIQYDSPKTVSEFEHSYKTAMNSQRSHIIEVKTDRAHNVQLHRDIETLIANEQI